MPFRFSLYEPVSFMKLFFDPYLEFEQKKEHVALHVPCTSKQAGLTDNFVALAERCSTQVSLTGVCFVWRVWQGSGERLIIVCVLLPAAQTSHAAAWRATGACGSQPSRPRPTITSTCSRMSRMATVTAGRVRSGSALPLPSTSAGALV